MGRALFSSHVFSLLRIPVLGLPIACWWIGICTANAAVREQDAKAMVRLPPTTTLLSASAPSVGACESVTLTALVSSALPGPHTGTVTFLDGNIILDVVPLDTNSAARITVGSLRMGQRVIRAMYSGDAGYRGSRSRPAKVKVIAEPVTLRVVAESGGAVLAGADVYFGTYLDEAPGSTCFATGKVRLMSGRYLLATNFYTGSGSSQGVSLWFESNEYARGNYPIYAIYDGDAHHRRTISPIIYQTITPVPHYAPNSLNGRRIAIYWVYYLSDQFPQNKKFVLSFTGTAGASSGHFSEPMEYPFGNDVLQGTYTWRRVSGTTGTLVTTVPGRFTHTFYLTFQSSGEGTFTGQPHPSSTRYYPGTFEF